MSEIDESQTRYLEVIHKIDQDPHSDEVWAQVVDIARKEESSPSANKGFYGRVPLEEMLAVAQQLREIDSLTEKYRILSEKTSTGDLWYDIILGRVNDKLLSVMGQEIGNWKDRIGYPAGPRHWKRGLDLGTGTGNSLSEMKKYVDESVGIDSLDFLLPLARSKSENSLLAAASALKLPFPKESFTLVQSNGLTFYLPKNVLDRLVAEIDRVLAPGGSYFQPYTMPPGEGNLIQVEREYLNSGKGLLVCLMDRLITSVFVETGDEPSEFNLISQAFKSHGFTRMTSLYKREGIIVLEFRKRFPSEFERLKQIFFSGDTFKAEPETRALLYGDRAAVVNPDRLTATDLLPPEDVFTNLDFLERLAQEQEIIEANPITSYYAVFVAPLVYLATNERFDLNMRLKAAQVMANNLKRIEQSGKFDKNSPHWVNKGFKKCCQRLRKSLETQNSSKIVVRQLDKMLEDKQV